MIALGEVTAGDVALQHLFEFGFDEGSQIGDFDVFVGRFPEFGFEHIHIDFAEIPLFAALHDLEFGFGFGDAFLRRFFFGGDHALVEQGADPETDRVDILAVDDGVQHFSQVLKNVDHFAGLLEDLGFAGFVERGDGVLVDDEGFAPDIFLQQSIGEVLEGAQVFEDVFFIEHTFKGNATLGAEGRALGEGFVEQGEEGDRRLAGGKSASWGVATENF
ncbi:MAG: hypothetical protein ISR59_10160 [Anaerolineales bacterium]|nr:hypothetical protein [Anaerolineales bacterium]